jgi:hypothetical protein
MIENKYSMRYTEMAAPSLDSQTYKIAAEHLRSAGLKAKDPKTARISKQRHIRIENSVQDIQNAVKQMGADMHYDNIPNLSGKFTEFAITFPEGYNVEQLAGKTIYALSNLKGDTKVAQKQLIPAKLGLGDSVYNKASLAAALQKNIPTTVQDEVLQQFLLELVDVAVGKRPAVDTEVMELLDPDTIRITGIDFGEILTPLILSDEQDDIVFPAGNAMLADVEINGQPISVKSASGSGTSFRAIKQYMDKFHDGIQNGEVVLTRDEEDIHKFFRTFVDTEGKNIDKIIAASAAVNTPEHQKLADLVSKQDFTYGDLVEFSDKFDDYGEFLKTIYPVSVAGNYKIKDNDRPNGLPADYQYYMGMTDKQPKAKQAGKPSWDADKGTAGANILTYVLGTSFLADAKKLEKSEKYGALIKRILGNVKASLAKVDITQDGKITIKQTPFDKLNYAFQYHAPSHIPGNNLPGFTLVLD